MSHAIELLNKLVTGGFEIFGKYYSSYMGFVANNEDPDNMSRLQLMVPLVYGTEVMEYWAFKKGDYSGPGYGMQMIPQKGDMVWVEFEKGDPRRPIWSFGHWGKGEKPEKLNPTHKYWLLTPQGNLVEIDDKEGFIRLTNSHGRTLEINKENISIGKEGKSDQPAVLGDDLHNILDELISAIEKLTVGTPTGPSGIPINLAEFKAIKAKLKQILSSNTTLS